MDINVIIRLVVSGLVALLFSFVGLVVLKRVWWTSPGVSDNGCKTFRPSVIVYAPTVLGGVAMVLLPIYSPLPGMIAWPFAIVGMVIGGFSLPSLLGLHQVVVRDGGIEGASTGFLLTLGQARDMLKWSEISRSGKAWNGYAYIETDDGRRVYWSDHYTGAAHLWNIVFENCPHLLVDQNGDHEGDDREG